MVLLGGTGKCEGEWLREGRFRQENQLEGECQALQWGQLKARMRTVALGKGGGHGLE